MSAPDRDQLLERFRTGEPDACRQFERWASEVVFSKRYGVAPADRDDLVQETLRQTWEHASRPGFRVEHSLRALVHRIAMARCVDWLRRRRVTVEMREELLREFPDPTARLEQERLLGAVHQAMQTLKPLCRDLIRWHFHEEKPCADIARDTGRNESTLRVHMFNCLRVLRSLMGMGDN